MIDSNQAWDDPDSPLRKLMDKWLEYIKVKAVPPPSCGFTFKGILFDGMEYSSWEEYDVAPNSDESLGMLPDYDQLIQGLWQYVKPHIEGEYNRIIIIFDSTIHFEPDSLSAEVTLKFHNAFITPIEKDGDEWKEIGETRDICNMNTDTTGSELLPSNNTLDQARIGELHDEFKEELEKEPMSVDEALAYGKGKAHK